MLTISFAVIKFFLEDMLFLSWLNCMLQGTNMVMLRNFENIPNNSPDMKN